ncbi:MAG TPA: adenylate/guanylate cyclase domain-containing protein [Gaiellaceae bacterium]|nr:adenylate/guanylate cyclase domain-containing protein [Gaiellaceae bacterium]
MAREIRYAESDGLQIAYDVFGSGPRDLVFVHGWVTNLELLWEHPRVARALERLGSFCRVINFDKRGTGLSDRVPVDRLPTLEQRMDDVRAVMDAAGSERAVLFGHSEGGPMCMLFAAAYPQRTEGLVLYGTFAVRRWQPDHPWGPTLEERERHVRRIKEEWGGVVHLEELAPDLVDDEEFRSWWARYLRSSASPAAAAALTSMNTDVDVRSVLPGITVPTLIVHHGGDRRVDVGAARWLAGQIPGARYVELPGDDHLIWADPDPIVDLVEEFVTGVPPAEVPDRVLLTVLFTDIVGSTETAAALGDEAWRRLLDRHDETVRRYLERYRGREVKTTGDGFLAVFDGPARAVRCAQAIGDAVGAFGLEIRAGAHTGEVERRGEDVGGVAVHAAARIASLAGPCEVLVSRTVRDLTSGSGIAFADRGPHELKGVPGVWELYAAS